MIESTAIFETENGQRYLEQLSKHFAHKVDVTHSGAHAEFRFSCGTGKLEATADSLLISTTAPGEDGLSETKEVIESHLARFAFREKPAPLEWSMAR